MKPPSTVAGVNFAAPISRAYDEPTPHTDEDSLVRLFSLSVLDPNTGTMYGILD